ncbi:hypothetical protein [Streptomyces sp. Ncost-T10-10d]|uniref:hypothetical protein n=1 Tax=Streptomyces sp. Ncost-T10-10d TaxID=1839774 RepID=UPI0035228A51
MLDSEWRFRITGARLIGLSRREQFPVLPPRSYGVARSNWSAVWCEPDAAVIAIHRFTSDAQQ